MLTAPFAPDADLLDWPLPELPSSPADRLLDTIVAELRTVRALFARDRATPWDCIGAIEADAYAAHEAGDLTALRRLYAETLDVHDEALNAR